ncbi:MAG TPA: GAF domain-containing protein [Chryseolinea sp.]|nr:GAF domain-containing protein [Chryseolinea sp.]
MNFLRNRSLKQLGLFTVVTMVLIFGGQFVIINSSIDKLHEAERKIDYARTTQLACVQVAFQTQAYLNGKKQLAPQIIVSIEQQDKRLKVLGEGGRMDDKVVFIKPLSRLANITYANLLESWVSYKENTALLLTQNEILEEQALAGEPDSLGNVVEPPIVRKQNTTYTTAKLNQEAQWLSMSEWFDKLIVDLEEEVNAKQNALIQLYVLIAFVNGLLLIGIYILFQRYVLKPLKELEVNTENNVHTIGLQKNEIGKIGIQINQTIENLKDATDFVTAIGEGKLTIDYKDSLDKNYAAGKNKLADSLIDMQAKLKQLNEEDRRRQWVNEGLAKFADILRSSNDNIALLCDKVIAALVQYTQSNQGGLYILNDEDENNKFLDMVSLFAFDLKKFEQRKVKLGEGILGQAFLEKETTYITDIPDEYIRITSGLGDANPNSILMVPLKVDTEVYGIVELASFKEYAPYVISFVEKLGETIASTLASVRAAEKNRQLIEQFQQQTEEMRAQEEEMRQNMEELQATQEESSRKEGGYIEQIAELEEKASDHANQITLAKASANTLVQEYRQKIEALEKELAQKTKRGDDWEIVSEVEAALKINLEALKITQEELHHKAGRN